MPNHSWLLWWATHNDRSQFSGHGLLSFQAPPHKREKKTHPDLALKSFSLSQRLGFPNFMNSVLFSVAEIDYPRCTPPPPPPPLCSVRLPQRDAYSKQETRHWRGCTPSAAKPQTEKCKKCLSHAPNAKTLPQKAPPWGSAGPSLALRNGARLRLWYAGSAHKHSGTRSICWADTPPSSPRHLRWLHRYSCGRTSRRTLMWVTLK